MKKRTELDKENYMNEGDSSVDEVTEVRNPAESFIQKYSKQIIIVSIVVIALVALLLYMRYQANEKEIRVATLMTRIVPYFQAGDYDKALNGDPDKTFLGEKVLGLKYIADEYQSTSQGKTASLYVATIYADKADYDNALSYFEKATKSNANIVRMGGLAGIASVHEQKGNLKEAAKNYQSASELAEDDNTKSRYSFYAALCFEKTDDKDKAEKIFRTIIEENQLTEFTPLAKAGLIRIGTIIE
jgi:tetratricopeptide (TPR) repeat protein